MNQIEQIDKYLKDCQTIKSTEDYFKYPALSSSVIKDLYYDGSALGKPRNVLPSLYMNLGSAVDILVTQPERADDIVVLNKIPSGNNKDMVELVLNDYEIDDLEELTDDNITELYHAVGSNVNWSTKVKREKFIEKSKEYFDTIKQNKNKVILTPQLDAQAKDISMVLQTSPYTRHLFNNTSDRYLIYYQYKIKFLLDDLEFKAMFDLLVIDTIEQVITVYDLKIGGNPFLKSFYTFKWYYQAVLYQIGLKFLLEQKPDLFATYLINDFTFIYVNTNNIRHPFKYCVPEEVHHYLTTIGISNGFHYIPPLRSLLHAAKYYIKAVEGEDNNNLTYESIQPYILNIHEGTIALDYFVTADLVL